MGILDLIGCACPAEPDRIGCLRLLDMAVMMGQCTLRQKKRDWKYQARLNDNNTDSQTAWQEGWQAIFVAGVSDLHMGRLAGDL